ncbi:MAG: ATP-binding protein [Bacteroidales bacterium]
MKNSFGKIWGAIEVNLDITDIREAEKKIRESEERVKLALGGADLGIWDWHPKTGDVVFDDRWSGMLGFLPGELEGHVRTWEKLLHPDDREEVWSILEEHLSGRTESYSSEYRMRTKEGGYRWILDKGKVTQRNPGGEAIRITGTHMDITDQKEAEQTMRRTLEESQDLNRQLGEAKHKAEESDRLKTAFLANLSHEIRTPMNGILGFADLLKSGNLEPGVQSHYVELIEQSGQRMLRLIADLVDISKIEAGQVEINAEPTSIHRIADKLCSFFQPQARNRGLDLICRCNVPEDSILTDNLKLEQIITNLINNALKFTQSGSITFSCERQNSDLLFSVRDTGTGIRPESQEFIFERFRQGENTYYSAAEGSGLGLAICKAFVELMGGRIWLESAPGKGSTFFFTLPFVPAAGKGAERSGAMVHHLDPEALVLIAEDDQVSFLVLEEILKPHHIRVLHARNGREALSMIETNPNIRLVLMDMKMPVLNGLEATRILRQKHPGLPVIAQSAYAAETDREKALSSGCNDFITKPIDRNLLLEKMERFLKAADESTSKNES